MANTKGCKKHGLINETNGYKEVSKGVERWRCLECRNLAHRLQRINRLAKVNNCTIHGPIDETTGYKENDRGIIRYRCKACKNNNARIRHAKNPHTKREQVKLWKKNNPDKVKINSHKYHDKHRDEINRKSKKRYFDNLEASRLKGRLQTKALTESDYHKMIAEQDNKCAICGLEETRLSKSEKGGVAALCIDHCHKTGKVRELLCHSCNTGIGKFKDSKELLQKAINYIDKHSLMEP